MVGQANERFDQALQLASQLSPAEQLRLISALSANLATTADVEHTQDAAASLPPVPPNKRVEWMDGPLVLIERANDPASPLLIPNGIDVATGEPLLTIDAATARRLATQRTESAERRALERERVDVAKPKLGMIYGKRYDNLAEAGWAIVVHRDDDAAVINVVLPLIRHRCEQQGIALPPLSFHKGETCGAWLARHVSDNRALPSPWHPKRSVRLPILLYETGQRSNQWLAQLGVAAGPVDPQRGVPFYLLLVGRPGPVAPNDVAFIPYDVQYDLDLFWGVGRLCFTDAHGQHDYAAYTAYAEQVVQHERHAASAARKHIVYLATHHQRDAATAASEEQLVLPLAHGDAQQGIAPLAQQYGFSQDVLTGDSASRTNLSNVLAGNAPGGKPALLFTATHGVGLRAADTRLPTQQGALICQDWSGVGPVKPEHWLASDGLPEHADVAGLIALCFACYSVGCPASDQYALAPNHTRQIAPRDLVAALPQRLLAAGALAVIGHVDRAWSYSFSVPEWGVTGQTQGFADLLGRLMGGERVGYATDQFNMRQAAFGGELSDLASKLPLAAGNPHFGLDRIGPLWRAYYDARSYAVLGDPAVQLSFARQETA